MDENVVVWFDGGPGLLYIAITDEDGRRVVYMNRQIPRLIDARDRFPLPDDRPAS